MPDVGLLYRAMSELGNQGLPTRLKTDPQKNWVIWDWLMVRADRLQIEKGGWIRQYTSPNVPILKNTAPIEKWLSHDVVAAKQTGVFPGARQTNSHRHYDVHRFVRSEKPSEVAFFQSCLVKIFVADPPLVPTFIYARGEICLAMRNRFGAIMGLVPSIKDIQIPNPADEEEDDDEDDDEDEDEVDEDE